MLVIAIDDADADGVCCACSTSTAGHAYWSQSGVPPDSSTGLPLLGISRHRQPARRRSRSARQYELGADDVVLTVLTDSVDLYRTPGGRAAPRSEGPYDDRPAPPSTSSAGSWGQTTEHMAELDVRERKRRIHNLKYFTWVEQQGKTVEELNAQWDPGYWEATQAQATEIDRLIGDFNQRVAAA